MLLKWKQRLGDDASYNNLISVFERSGHKDLADFIKSLEPEVVQKTTKVEQENQNESRDITGSQQQLANPQVYLVSRLKFEEGNRKSTLVVS